MCDVGLKDPIFCAILLLRGLSQTEPTDQLVFGFFLFFSFLFFQLCLTNNSLAWKQTDDYRQRRLPQWGTWALLL